MSVNTPVQQLMSWGIAHTLITHHQSASQIDTIFEFYDKIFNPLFHDSWYI